MVDPGCRYAHPGYACCSLRDLGFDPKDGAPPRQAGGTRRLTKATRLGLTRPVAFGCLLRRLDPLLLPRLRPTPCQHRLKEPPRLTCRRQPHFAVAPAFYVSLGFQLSATD